MPTQSRRKSISVIQKLLDAPYAYQFQQAVRLLERAAVFENENAPTQIAANPIGRFTPPANESVRLGGGTSLAFPSSEVAAIELQEQRYPRKQWRLLVNVMSLTGSMGVLPYHYTELLLKRLKQKDEAMEKFFDLFSHRTISLFFQASSKYRLPLQYERHRLHNRGEFRRDVHTQALLSLIGMGTDGLGGRLTTKDEALIQYGGLLSQTVRTSTGLKQLLRSHFKVPVEIEQFVGQWQPLVDDVRTSLPDPRAPKGRNACLGRSAMLGKSGWFAQGRIRIILGPLNEAQLRHFSPGTSALKALHELTQFYVGLENDYEFVIRVRERDFPERSVFNKHNPPIMGWNARLASSPSRFRTKRETLDISVSSNRLM